MSVPENTASTAPGTMTVIRYQARPEAADANQRLIEKVFAELRAEHPDGVRYAAFRSADGNEFIHLLSVDEAVAGGNPITALAAFAEFQHGIAERVVAPPNRTQLDVVGAYGVFE
jgi:hypothetical protein